MKPKLFIYIALVTDILITITKFTAAIITGSSAMISEGIHSTIDSISQLLLILGVKKSKRKPDAQRPFGYGREMYFWSFIVSLIIFIVGGCISFYEGLIRFQHPTLQENLGLDYIVLTIAFLFTSVSAIASFKAFNKERGRQTFWKALKQSKDPATFIVLLGDLGDILGILIAFLGIFLGHLFKNPYYDGIASMLIGVILIIISLLLVQESKSLLLGEPIGKKTLKEIITLIEQDADIIQIKKHFSTYMAPEEVVLQVIAVFKKELTTTDITKAIERICINTMKEFPRIKQMFIEPAEM